MGLCVFSEFIVLFMNIVCFCIGVGVYGWFAWLERQDQLKGTVKVFVQTLHICRHVDYVVKKVWGNGCVKITSYSMVI